MNSASTPQLIFHIGDPKTGTSSIQRALQNRSAKCSSLTIQPWRKLNASVLASGLTAKDPDVKQQHFKDIRNWLKGSEADFAVISSEYMARMNPKPFHRLLRKYLPRYSDNVRIIAYVRPHASRFLAAFVQRTKTGTYFDSFDNFHATIENDKPPTLRYADRFSRWQDAFGEQFTLRPFVRSELRDNDVVPDFFSVVFQDVPFEVSDVVEENVSVTTRSLSGLRQMHERFRDLGVNPAARGLLGSALANFFIPTEAVTGEKPKLDQKTAEQLIERYREDAKALDAAFFSRPLMQTALEHCNRNTRADPVDLTASAHFSASEIQDLHGLADDIGKRFLQRNRLWTMHHNSRWGKLNPTPDQVLDIEIQQPKLQEIDAKMAEAAAILRG